MTIILFLVDTSGSMYQRVHTTSGRTTLIDVAKIAVEAFVKCRQRNTESRGDRYMLLTFEEAPENIKSGWKENLQTFMRELKNLECTHRTTMGDALRQAFDLLNLNRMQSGIDTYGQGRSPFYLEPAIILLITDGGPYFNNATVTDELSLPMNSVVPGIGLTKEPFRWDQRLYALVLRLPGNVIVEKDVEYVPRDELQIDTMCEVTGGRSYCITSQRMLMQCVESLVHKVQSGVVVRFEMMTPEDKGVSRKNSPLDEAAVPRLNARLNKPWQSVRNFVYVPRSAQKGLLNGFWPIPESYWPDMNLLALPPRNAHPRINFSCINQDPIVVEHIPCDRYELEPSPLTQFILSRKQPHLCWPVFVANSGKMPDSGQSFGYLKVNAKLTHVYLIVLPYNYRVLLPQLDELLKTFRLKPTHDWVKTFHSYLASVPVYYVSLLRRALLRMGVASSFTHTLIPDYISSQLNYNVQTYLQKLRTQAKTDFEVLCNRVIFLQNKRQTESPRRFVEVALRALPKTDYVTHPSMTRKHYSARDYHPHLLCPTLRPTNGISHLRNPFEVRRGALLDQIVRMRTNFCRPVSQMRARDADARHHLPIAEMGNYQDYLKRMPSPLRQLEPKILQRSNMFGNPFKNDAQIMVDEADEDIGDTETRSSASNGGDAKLPRKRRPGPLPKSYAYKRSAERDTSSPSYSLKLIKF